MQALRQFRHRRNRGQGQKRAEKMAMECILCFAVMKKLKPALQGDEDAAGQWVRGRVLFEKEVR